MHNINQDDVVAIPMSELSYNIAELRKKYNRMTLEEYQSIQVDEQPVNHLYIPPANPRNDPGKRLVFFCQVI